MDTPKVSFIIPVYNSEKYLEKCIRSVLNQNFDDFELILVNDGSKDGSGLLCDAYAQKDFRIKVLHQQNQGVSAARNTGIKYATGEWCCFVDSDDWIEPDYLCAFFSNLPDKNTLIVQEVKKSFGKKIKVTRDYQHKTYPTNDFCNLLKNNLILFNGFPFAKLYNLNIIKDNNLYFNTDIKFAEDLIFFLDYLKHIDSVTFIKESFYVYVYNNQSASYKLHLFEDYEKSIESYKKSLSYLLKQEKWKEIEQIESSFSVFFTLSIFSFYKSKVDKSERINYLKQLFLAGNTKVLLSTTSNFNFIRKFAFLLLNYQKYSFADCLLKVYVPIEFEFMLPFKRNVKSIIGKG